MFKITNASGFHIRFNNGYSVSVQFGPMAYADNHNKGYDEQAEQAAGKRGSSTAECAVVKPDGNLAYWWGGEAVRGYCTPEEMLALMNEVAALEPVKQ
jgi:hypothetical protein